MRSEARQKFLGRPARRLTLVAGLMLAASGPAVQAQTSGAAPSFWLQLFGLGKPQSPAPRPAAPSVAPKVAPSVAPSAPAAPSAQIVHRLRKPKPRDFVPATETRAPGTPGGSPAQASFFIEVLGDSLAVLAAEGLTQAYADRPEVAVQEKARESSGLVRDDYYDWTKAARDLAQSNDHIDYVVIEIGINDLQALKDGADSVAPLSERWDAIYGARIEALVETFRAKHIPVAWIGLPPMRLDSFNASVVKLNELFKLHAEKADAHFIDIWDAFANQAGQYDAFGPDIDGQQTKLRGADGIHFTKAGSRKIAHFLEADIKRVLDRAKPQSEVASLPPDIEQAAVDINAQIRREMGAPAPSSGAPSEPARPLAGPILPLTDRPISVGGVLASYENIGGKPLGPAARALRLGDTPPAQLGRADDFSWPRQ